MPSLTPSRTSPFFWNEEVRPGLRVAFTASGAGNLGLHVGDDPEGVLANRRRLEAAMGVRGGSLRFMNQTHSDRMAVIGRSPAAQAGPGPSDRMDRRTGHRTGHWVDQRNRTGDGRGITDAASATAPDADGMISPRGADPLAVLVADCVPIVLADPNGTGATAVVHAGRVGVASGIVGTAVASMRRAGAREIVAWIGPSVCGSCYEVPEEMMLAVARTLPEAAARTRSGSAALDLPAAVRRQLRDAGTTVEPVDGDGSPCTLENEGLFSHRRMPGAGRIAGLVWRP